MEHTHSPIDNEIDLLDLLVTIAGNIKLLVLGPLVAGLLALGISFTLPNTFESKAVVNVNVEGVDPNVLVSMATTAAVLEPVRVQIGFKLELPAERALNELRDSIKVSVGKVDKLITITATAPTPEQAQRTNKVMLAELLNQYKPQGADLARLNARLQFEKEAFTKALKLEEELIAAIKSGKESGLLSANIVNVITIQGEHFAMIQSLEAKIEGLSQNAVLQPSTLPEKPLSTKKGQKATIAALATGFALLLFVFVRQALRNAGLNVESADKLARIRDDLGLKSSRG